MAMPIQYNIGEIVFALEDMFNDGGLPGYAEEALIAPAGSRGVIVHIGHVAADERVEIYLVRFEDQDGNLGVPVGCLLEEITQDEALARSLVGTLVPA